MPKNSRGSVESKAKLDLSQLDELATSVRAYGKKGVSYDENRLLAKVKTKTSTLVEAKDTLQVAFKLHAHVMTVKQWEKFMMNVASHEDMTIKAEHVNGWAKCMALRWRNMIQHVRQALRYPAAGKTNATVGD